ncbi:MAG: MFS transporter [Chloroflexi bacterium]|nr:MFS transporter [Chloroflexota bacterium]
MGNTVRTAEAGEAPRLAGIRLPRTFLSARHRDFRYLLTGTFFSSTAQWIQQVSIGWLVYQLTGSALLLGAVSATRTVPFLLAPFAGVVADRMDPKRILVISQIFLAVVATVFAFDLALHFVQVWHIFAFNFLVGMGFIFNQSVRQVLVPLVVPRKDLSNAIALNSAGFTVTRVIGPAVGGILIALISIAGNFFLQSVCYLAVALSTLPIRAQRPRLERPGPMLQSFFGGLQVLKEDAALLSLVLIGLVPALLAMPFQALLPIFAKDILDVGPEGLGMLMAASGVGALVGTLTLASFSNMARRGQVMLGMGVLMGVGLVLFALSNSLTLSLLAMVFVGAVQMSFFTLNTVMLQTLVPDAVRGRVLSLSMLDMGLMPLGSLMLGVLAEVMGAPHAVIVEGALVAGAFVAAVIWIPHLRRL